jgi:ParB family transcriptional regulator, chromosome partitioning protein
MKVHQVKCWNDYFEAIASGDKTFDLRKDDRNYAVDDHVVFEEFRQAVGEYTGRVTRRRIKYILRDFDGLQPGYCILGLEYTMQ